MGGGIEISKTYMGKEGIIRKLLNKYKITEFALCNELTHIKDNSVRGDQTACLSQFCSKIQEVLRNLWGNGIYISESLINKFYRKGQNVDPETLKGFLILVAFTCIRKINKNKKCEGYKKCEKCCISEIRYIESTIGALIDCIQISIAFDIQELAPTEKYKLNKYFNYYFCVTDKTYALLGAYHYLSNTEKEEFDKIVDEHFPKSGNVKKDDIDTDFFSDLQKYIFLNQIDNASINKEYNEEAKKGGVAKTISAELQEKGIVFEIGEVLVRVDYLFRLVDSHTHLAMKLRCLLLCKDSTDILLDFLKEKFSNYDNKNNIEIVLNVLYDVFREQFLGSEFLLM